MENKEKAPDFLEQDLEQDAAPPVDDDALQEIAKLGADQVRLEDSVEDLENRLKEMKERLRNVSENLLPAAMASIGMASFKLAEGYSITVKEDIAANISKANQPKAFDWLREHEHGDLIKNEIKATLGRGEEKIAQQLLAKMAEIGVQKFASKESIHPQTLKAFCKEQLESGAEFPPDLFSIFEIKKAKISRK
mgnify:CR=1 FL=1